MRATLLIPIAIGLAALVDAIGGLAHLSTGATYGVGAVLLAALVMIGVPWSVGIIAGDAPRHRAHRHS